MERRRGPEAPLPHFEQNRQKAVDGLNRYLQLPEETKLKKHQISMIDSLHTFFAAGNTAGYIDAPSGIGKSAALVTIADAVNLDALILSPTQQILDQNVEEALTFTESKNITTYDGRNHDDTGDKVFSTYQSMHWVQKLREAGKRVDFHPERFGIVMLDEVDTGLGEKRHVIYRELFPNALFVGLTATPYFGSIEGYKDRGMVDERERWLGLFKNLIHEMTLEEAMTRNLLAHLDVYMLETNINLADMPLLTTGQYRQEDLQKLAQIPVIDAMIKAILAGVEHIPDNIRLPKQKIEELDRLHQLAKGRRAFCFENSIAQADLRAEGLQKAGVVAEAFHNEIPVDERHTILKNHIKAPHRIDAVPVVTGVDMLGRGVNSPPTDLLLFPSMTRSAVELKQQIGRGTRKSPKTRKTRTLAIQFHYNLNKSYQAPVLITDLFDTDYIARGSQTGKEPGKAAPSSEPKQPPVVTFSGINIETILREARSRDIIKNRFKNATIFEIHETIEDMFQKVQGEFPQLGLYQTCQEVIRRLPRHLPEEAAEAAKQAIASLDTNTVNLGKRALIYLNLQTLVTTVGNFLPMAEGDEDDMLKEAMLGLYDKSGRLRKNTRVSQQFHQASSEAIAKYIAERDHVHVDLVKDPNFALIYEEVNALTAFAPEQLTDDDIDRFSEELSDMTGASEREIRKFMKNKAIHWAPIEEQLYDVFPPNEEEKNREGLNSALNEALSQLTQVQRTVLELRFGLYDGEKWTLQQIAKHSVEYLGRKITQERVRQIEMQGLRTIRHPRVGKHLRRYLH